MYNKTIWKENIKPLLNNKKIKKQVDVLIIGGGIAGMTALYQLSETKKNILLIDKGRIGFGVSANTTGKITYLQDEIYEQIENMYHFEIAKKYLYAQLEAINFLKNVIKKEQIDCDFQRVDSYVFANKKEDILEAFQPFYQETSLEQEVNVDLIYQTEKELLDYAIYNENDIRAFTDIWNHPGKQDATAMGKMTSVLKPVADRYNLKNPEERYQFRRQVRKLLRWYSYITQVVRMFDTDMHKEYLFLSYLIGLLPEEKEEPIDLEGKLKLEYYKLQKTFEGAIKLEKVDGQYVPSKKQGAQGIRQKSTLDEILDKINEKYKGQFTDGDRVMLGALHDKLIADDKLASSARTSDPRIFTESIFPSAFGNAAMESYMEAQDSYGSLFEDKSKYDAVMSALAGVIYREMRSKKTVDYRKIERDEQVQMVAEEPVKYGE